MRPTVSGITLQPRRFSLGGTTLHYALDDSSTIDAEIWHSSHGRRGTYAGWQQWRGHIGFNQVRFASRHRHFKPRPGSYIAYLTPTDFFGNMGRTKDGSLHDLGAAARRTPSSTVNAEPSTVTRPPWRSTIAETIDSPRPEPGRSAESGPRQKRSNIRSCCSGLAPGPRH